MSAQFRYGESKKSPCRYLGDLMYDAKVLTTKYGSATKRDLFKANKMVKRVN